MYIEWSDLFAIGVPKIDAQHRHLVSIINAFHEHLSTGGGEERLFAVLNLLTKYAEVHFRCEEGLMAAVHYPERVKQQREHERLIEEIFVLAERLGAREEQVTLATAEFLKHWLLDHVLTLDRRLEPFFREKGVPEGWERAEP